MAAPPTLELDHLLVAAASLEDGVATTAAALGIDASAFSPEGKHALLGTHNRLLSLGPGCYLEVIAVDPSVPPQQRTRWFALDEPQQCSELASRPRLLTWVARLAPPADLSALREQPGHGWVPPVVQMERGEFRWCIAVPDDGSLPSWPANADRAAEGSLAGGGVLPTLIQWDVPHTPAERLPPSGLRLRRLVARHPRPDAVRAALAAMGAADLVAMEESPAREPSLAAEVETPDGLRILM